MFPLQGGQHAKTYVDDVFSTYIYTGNGSTKTITNGIDLAGKGGLVWTKCRTFSIGHFLYDTTRGATNKLSSNLTNAASVYSGLTSFSSSGFNLGSGPDTNDTTIPYVSWTFRKAPKFFDVVTYTGDGVAYRNIAHSLGVAPGMIIVKRTDSTSNWVVWHRKNGNADLAVSGLALNLTNASVENYASQQSSASFNVAWVLDLDFTEPNINGATYVAYLFAHDTSTDGIIQCGSALGDQSQINLGWEPQYILCKIVSGGTGDWNVYDSMRGFSIQNGMNGAELSPNTSVAENGVNGFIKINATGFSINENSAATYIYLAIRRPNKPPTSGTQVYNAIARTGTGATATVTGVGFTPDSVLIKQRNTNNNNGFYDRLRGPLKRLTTPLTDAEQTDTATVTGFDNMDGVSMGADGSGIVNGTSPYINHFFRRAPGFFDVVCYTGTGSATTVAHNLGVAPELMIVKSRVSTLTSWFVYTTALGPTKSLFLEQTATPNTSTVFWNDTTPTASGFSLGSGAGANASGGAFVAYLFASLPGISKVGSYTGNGTSQTINCGFSTGARFVLVKCASTGGDWYVWDTARGIVSANDPHLSLNTTAAEVTTDDSVDPDNSGFIVNQVTATSVNVNAATYIYLAIA